MTSLTNGHGPTWKWVAVAAVGCLAALLGLGISVATWAHSDMTRRIDKVDASQLENASNINTLRTDSAVIKKDIEAIKDAVQRIEEGAIGDRRRRHGR